MSRTYLHTFVRHVCVTGPLATSMNCSELRLCSTSGDRVRMEFKKFPENSIARMVSGTGPASESVWCRGRINTLLSRRGSRHTRMLSTRLMPYVNELTQSAGYWLVRMNLWSAMHFVQSRFNFVLQVFKVVYAAFLLEIVVSTNWMRIHSRVMCYHRSRIVI